MSPWLEPEVTSEDGPPPEAATVRAEIRPQTPILPLAGSGPPAAPATTLLADAFGPKTLVSPVERPAGAVAGGKVLVAYQWTKGWTESIRARLFDPAHPGGGELRLTPANDIYGDPEVISHGSRFFVTWRHGWGPDRQGRWVEADGTLGPVLHLPVEGASMGVRLVAHGSGFAGAYANLREEGGFTLYSVLLDADLKPIAPGLALDDAQHFGDLTVKQLVLRNGQIWVAAEGTGRRRSSMQLHLIRLGADGTVIGTVDEVSNTRGDALLPGVVEVPAGVLFSWLEQPSEGLPGKLWTRKLDVAGKPLGPALMIGEGGTRSEGLELVLDQGQPLLITQRGRTLRLDASGAVRAEATAVPAAGTQSIWLATAPSPSLAWIESRGTKNELVFASLRCATGTARPR